jgi:D-glycero-alpha-D-manno-heptose-7-phosphate kinase
MAAMVPHFRNSLVEGDFKAIGAMLHEGWLRKKELSSGISNSAIDSLYGAGMRAGAWGGKVLGAGGGGCLLFVAPPDRKERIRKAIWEVARDAELSELKHIPVRFVQSGAEPLFQHGESHAIAL